MSLCHEDMTDVELAERAYLTLSSADDELPDNAKVDSAIHLMGDLWDRLVGPYCKAPGCTSLRLTSFPWCSTPGHEATVRAMRLSGG